MRVAFLASAPGVILATIAALVVDVVAPPRPAGLIVAIPTAAVGTTLLAVVAVAIARRARAKAADEISSDDEIPSYRPETPA